MAVEEEADVNLETVDGQPLSSDCSQGGSNVRGLFIVLSLDTGGR